MSEIIELTRYFKDLSARHKEVLGYKTGEIYETNHQNGEYPMIWVRFPMNGNIGDADNNDWINIQFILACYTNKIYDEYGNSQDISEHTQETPHNQINYTVDMPADTQIQKCFQILNHFIAKFRDDLDSGVINGIWGSATFETKERVFDDDLNGVEATINYRIENIYNCEYENYFEN